VQVAQMYKCTPPAKQQHAATAAAAQTSGKDCTYGLRRPFTRYDKIIWVAAASDVGRYGDL